MGCQAVSVYHDETSGAVGYPQKILVDLDDRNFCSGNLLKNVLTTHPYYVMGFNQSFAEARLFTYVLNKKEYFIYSAGRFLVIVDTKTKQQRSIMHEDKIIGLDCKGKLCLTATIGGRILIWDLQFFQKKVNIKLPESIVSISSVSFTQKYIFCTDTQQPNNNIYCYDMRTTKFKAKAQILSYEQTFKGINWGINQHVTVAADGVWFCKFVESTCSVEVVKGMFRIFPKTSMTCICPVDEVYLLTGSVDGYIFLWAHLQCQKAMKVGDSPLSEMYLHKNKLIVSNFSDNIRVFEYTIKKKQKIEKDQQQNGQITEDFVSVIIDSYERQPLQSIVVSKLDQSMYYAQTRSGLMYNKMIPSAQNLKKMNSYKETEEKFIQFQKDTLKYIHMDCIWLVRYNKPFFQIKQITVNEDPSSWKVNFRYISNAKKYSNVHNRPLYGLIPQLKKMIYVGVNKIYSCQIADIEANPDLKIDSLKQTVILQFEAEGPNSLITRGFVHFQVKQKLYLILFFDTQYLVLKYQGAKWVNFKGDEYEKQVIKQIIIEDVTVSFENRNLEYRVTTPEITKEIKQKMSFMHCVHQIEELNKIGSGKMLSLGGSFGLINPK